MPGPTFSFQDGWSRIASRWCARWLCCATIRDAEQVVLDIGGKMPARRNFWYLYGMPIFALTVLCGLVYSNSLQNSFHLDDYYMIVDNPGIREVQPAWRHFMDPATVSAIKSIVVYRPLLPLTLSLNYAFSGLQPTSYHVFSIVTHTVASVFVFLLLEALLGFRAEASLPEAARRRAAFFAATVFAVHPISGFPVNYLCGRDLLMMQAFLAICFFSYVRMRKLGETPLRWTITLLFLVLSLFSKSNAVMAPVVILLFEFFIAGESLTSRRLWLRVLPFAATVIVFHLWVQFFVRFSVVENALAEGFRTSVVYLMTQIKLHLFHYLRNFLWPFEVRGIPFVEKVETPQDVHMLLGLLFIIGTLGAGWRLRHRSPVVSFCIFAYWVMMSLESSVLPLHRLAADYRVYPALPFLLLIIFLVVFTFLPSRPATTLALVLLLFFGGSSYAMNRHFMDDKSFYGQSVRYGSDETGTMNYGMSFRGEDDETARKYLELSLQINPMYYLAYINLGLYYMDMGKGEKGLMLVRKGASLSPVIGKDLSYYWLAIAYEKAGDLTNARNAIMESLKYNSYNLDYLYEAAFIAQALSRFDEALGYLDRVHQSQPNFKLSRFIAGWCYQATGRIEKGLEEYRLALHYTPYCAQTYANMGYALMELVRYEEAAGFFEGYLQFVPTDEGARISREECLKRKEQP